MDENTPLVSIITITYNRGDLIHRCIESIQHQTYRNYEHIIMDGNSKDNTRQVVESYNDPHIVYVHLDKNGCEYQMKQGSLRAKGKYVTFLDDDDEYLPDKLEKQVRKFETLSEDYGILYCWMTYYDSSRPEQPLYIHKPEFKDDVHVEAVTGPNICGTPTLMIRNSVFQEFGGTYNDECGLPGSDWELCARISQKYKVEYIPESLIKIYINHEGSRLTTDIQRQQRIQFSEYFLENFKSIFEEDFRRANYHIYELCRYNAELKNYKGFTKYYRNLIKTKPTLRQMLVPLFKFAFGHK